MSEPLEEPPRVRVEVLEDRSATSRCDQGFLTLRRLTLRHHWADGEASAPYAYDVVERAALDAVAIVLVCDGRVCLRSSIRPPLAFRTEYTLPIPDPDASASLWEVPAGLVELEERGLEGLARCAARETLEEVGLVVAPEAFAPLGPAACLSPGVLGEKLHFLVADVDASRRGTPLEDGSPTEARAEVRFVAIEDALAACRDGRIADLKTETAIRRVAEREAAR